MIYDHGYTGIMSSNCLPIKIFNKFLMYDEYISFKSLVDSVSIETIVFLETLKLLSSNTFEHMSHTLKFTRCWYAWLLDNW